MDSISAIPQQPQLGRLAQFLRALESEKPEFLPRQLDVMGLIRQLALPSASTVENLSYGNLPFTMPPAGTGAAIPQVKTGRKPEVADLVGMLGGVPGLGAVSDVGTKLSNEAADAIVRAITRNPEATAQRVIQETSMPFMQAVAPKIVRPGDKVSGLTVREEVPNVSSIPASLDDYEILSGIREVPRGAFDKEYLDSLSFENLDKRTKDLARQIQESKEINPMIVGVDSKGAYIIEGGHRFDALMAQDTKSIPAMVVVDKSDPPSDDVLKGLLEPKTPKFKMPSFASLRPETTEDVDKIYDYLEKQAKKSGFRTESGASNVSNSRYLTIQKDLGNDEISTIEVRISAHGDRHPFTYATDGKISIDPARGGVDLETALWELQEKGYDLIK